MWVVPFSMAHPASPPTIIGNRRIANPVVSRLDSDTPRLNLPSTKAEKGPMSVDSRTILLLLNEILVERSRTRTGIRDEEVDGDEECYSCSLVRRDVCNVPASWRIREAQLKGRESENGGGVDCRDDQSNSGCDSSSTEEAPGGPKDDGSGGGEDS